MKTNKKYKIKKNIIRIMYYIKETCLRFFITVVPHLALQGHPSELDVRILGLNYNQRLGSCGDVSILGVLSALPEEGAWDSTSR